VLGMEHPRQRRGDTRISNVAGRTISSAIHRILLGDCVKALHVKTESSNGDGTSSHVKALHVKTESSLDRILIVLIESPCFSLF